MLIRPARETDLAQLSQLIAQSVCTLNAVDDSPADLAYICAKHDVQNLRLHLQSRKVFVMEIKGLLVGTVSLGGDKLHTLFVDSTSAKKGYGRILVRHIEAVPVAMEFQH